MIPYSAVFGGYDKPQRAPAGGVLFTDSMPPESFGWGARVVTPPFPDNLARSNRYYKLQPHQHFPEGARVLYFDARVNLLHSPEETLAGFQDLAGGDHDVFLLTHTLNHDVEQEIAWVREKGITAPSVLDAQRERYARHEGLLKLPTCQAPIIIAKRNERTSEFFSVWWAEVRDYSHRDQISYAYARWMTGVDARLIPYERARPLFKLRPHAKPQLREVI